MTELERARTRRTLTIITCLALIASAGVMPVFGPLLTSIARSFGITVETASIMVSLQLAGYVCAVLVGGHLGDQWGKRTVILIGLTLTVISLLGMALVRAWLVMLGLQVLLGLGLGGAIGSSVAFVSELNPAARSSALGVSQVATGIGSLVATGLAGVMVGNGFDWSVTLLIVVALNVAVFLLYLPFPNVHAPPVKHTNTSFAIVRLFLRSPILQLLFVSNALTVGSQQVLMTFSAPYLEIGVGAPILLASLGPISFWLGITVGRVIFSTTIERFDKDRVWVACAGGTALALLMMLFLREPLLIVGVLALGGLLIGALVPSAVDRGNTAYPHQSGLATGIILAAAGVGSVSMSFLATNLSAAASLAAAFWLTAGAMALNLGIILLFARQYAFQYLKNH